MTTTSTKTTNTAFLGCCLNSGAQLRARLDTKQTLIQTDEAGDMCRF